MLDAEQTRAIEVILTRFTKHHRAPLAVGILTHPPEPIANQSADRLRASWFGHNQDAVVLVYAQQTGRLGLSDNGFLENGILLADLQAIRDEAQDLLASRPLGQEPSGTLLTIALVELIRDLDAALERPSGKAAALPEPSPLPRDATSTYALVGLVMALLSLSLAAILWFRQGRRNRPLAGGPFHFPDAVQPERLGGPHAAGTGVTIDHAPGHTGPVTIRPDAER